MALPYAMLLKVKDGKVKFRQPVPRVNLLPSLETLPSAEVAAHPLRFICDYSSKHRSIVPVGGGYKKLFL